MSRIGVLPIYPYLGEEDESLRVGRREVSLGDFRVYALLSLHPSRQAGRYPQIVVDCSSRWTDYMLLLPSRTSQSIFPIARET